MFLYDYLGFETDIGLYFSDYWFTQTMPTGGWQSNDAPVSYNSSILKGYFLTERVSFRLWNNIFYYAIPQLYFEGGIIYYPSLNVIDTKAGVGLQFAINNY